jgi:hypothetical protein
MIRDSSVGIAVVYGLDGQRSISGRDKRFFSAVFSPALGPTQPPIQWMLSLEGGGGKVAVGVKLTTHLQLVQRSGMVELYLHSPYVFMTWCLIN